jgi:hypothetical protein
LPEHPRRHRHRKDPIAAADALKRFRRRTGGPSSAGPAAAAARVWVAVVGPAAAAHSVPIRCTRAGVLTIACSDSAWAHELSARRDQLTARLIAQCPDAGIAGLRFAVADHALPVAPEVVPDAPRPPAPTPRQRLDAAAAAAGVSDPVLRDLVERAAAASAARISRRSDR